MVKNPVFEDKRHHQSRQSRGTNTPSTLQANSAVQDRFDQLNVDDKVGLEIKASEFLRHMESAIINGDFNSLQTTLQTFNSNPESAQPIMKVLIKDLRAAGVSCKYNVDLAKTDRGAEEKSGMLHMATEHDKEICMYTNPNSSAWASRDVAALFGCGFQSMDSFNIPADVALKDVGARAASRLLKSEQ